MALTDKLSAIGNAIREKSGTTELLTLDEMPTAIGAIETGGGGDITAEDLTFTGNINNLFNNGNWLWVIDRYSSLVTFNNITNAQNVFGAATKCKDLSKINLPFNGAIIQSMFANCSELEKLPKVSGTCSRYFSGLFSSCSLLTSDEVNSFVSNITIKENDSNCNIHAMFPQCNSLRDLTYFMEWMDKGLVGYTGSISASIYNQLIYYCTSLDELTNLFIPRHSYTRTSNLFFNAFDHAERLKNMMFKTDNGIPYTVSWKSQTIDLSNYVGYVSYTSYICDYNSGITADKEVKDDATYQALKDNPDWFACKEEYSRYNHDSAVNTINSLPDTSAYLATAGGTNTIKFKGASGALTDGGAINTLTEEEIAVAAAKGWTVTLS